MSETELKPATQTAAPTLKQAVAAEKQSSTKNKAPANAEAQSLADKENEQGFRGAKVDQVDNFNYTVAGVLAGLPTPETDKTEGENGALVKK